MINAESMNTRLRHLRSRIERHQTLKSISRETFFADMDARDAVERNSQIAVECCLDIAKHIIVARSLQRPDELREVFHVLAQAKLLPEDLSQTMKDFSC